MTKARLKHNPNTSLQKTGSGSLNYNEKITSTVCQKSLVDSYVIDITQKWTRPLRHIVLNQVAEPVSGQTGEDYD